MSDISQLFAAADNAGLKREKFRQLSSQLVAEAEALVRQADAKRVEAASYLGEAAKQDEAYEKAIGELVLANIGREDAVKMVDLRVKALLSTNIRISMDEAKPKAKAAAKKPKARPASDQDDAPRGAEPPTPMASASDGPRSEPVAEQPAGSEAAVASVEAGVEPVAVAGVRLPEFLEDSDR